MEDTRVHQTTPGSSVKAVRRLGTRACRLVAICSTVFILQAPSPSADPLPGPSQSIPELEARDSGAGGATVAYTIGPGDVLNILVWKEPDFSGEFTVRFDGQVSLPLVGDVKALQRTPEELSKILEEALKRYVETPRVTVTVAEINSARFFVLGKVAVQGAFPYTGRIRVAQALALAGGFQEFAKLDKIFVIRDSENGQRHFPVDYEKLVNERNLDVNIVILPGDTIIVP